MAEYTHQDMTYHIKVSKEQGAAEMRERAAKLVEDRYPLDDGEAHDLAEAIRALPLSFDQEDG